MGCSVYSGQLLLRWQRAKAQQEDKTIDNGNDGEEYDCVHH